MTTTETSSYQHVDYLWSDADAPSGDEVALLIYRSNLLGRDGRITNTGGGNTSSKITQLDPLTGERVEVPLTMNHWEAADLAKVVPLARGWERQLDQKANPIFYDDEPLTASSYHDWLRENAVRWVALPNAPLDYSAREEAAVLERGARFLKLVYESPRWRIWQVRGTDPPASNGATVLATGPNWFMVHASKPTVVRYRYTPYWSTNGACVPR